MFLVPARRDGRRFLNPVPTQVGGFSIFFKVGWKFILRGKERSPQRPPGPFRTDANVYATPPASGLRVTWFGHASSLVEMDGARILIDPVWDKRASPMSWSGPKRFFPPTLALSELPPLDAVLLSHDHYDHLGASTIRALASVPAARNARWIAPIGVPALLQKFGVRAAQCVELDWMGSTRVGAVDITALPTRHFSGRGAFNRFETLWASFALIAPQHRVLYGADSGEWPGFAEIGERFGPFDLTMLEIGASDPLWAEIHMGPEGAVRMFKALGGHGLFMPIHWGLFDLAFHHWLQPIELISGVEGLPVWSPTPGEPTEVVAGRQLRSTWWKQ